MLLLDPFREACQSLRFHASRTFSMGFGIFWAVFVFVCLVAIANGFHSGVSELFAKYGTKTMLIYKSRRNIDSAPMTKEIVSNLARSFKSIEQISPISRHIAPIVYGRKQYNIPILGCAASYRLLANLPLQEGRFFTPRDEIAPNTLCVLGMHTKEKLFGKGSAVGEYILLGSVGLQVVGVLDGLDADLYGESDAILITNALSRRLFPDASDSLSNIRLSLVPNASEDIVEKDLRGYFARHLNLGNKGQKNISIFSIAKHAAKFTNLYNNISVFNVIVGICLLITGIVSISNMMLVIIEERKQELAIRKILSSRSSEIVAMILSEVAIVTLFAGMVGFTASYSLIALFNQWVVPFSKAYCLSTLTCPFPFIFGGLGAIILTACLAALIPAIKALSIKPVEALGSK